MLIFAHRGLKLKYQENTIPAFRAAAELGFGVELDVRLTKDKQLVCIHDSDTKRVTGTSLVVKDATIEELMQIKFGFKHDSGIRPTQIALFENVVQEVISGFGPQQKTAVHLKNEEQGEEQLQLLADVFRAHNLYEKAFVFDLTFVAAEKLRDIDSGIKIAVSVGEKNYSPTIYTKEDIVEYLGYIDIIWADEWKDNLYTKEFFQYYKELGKEVYVVSPELHKTEKHKYAENPTELWERIATFPFDGICTDFPKEAKDFFSVRQR